MLVKHKSLETSYKGDVQTRICNMAKAGLLELQSPSSNRRGFRRLVEAKSKRDCWSISRREQQAVSLFQRTVQFVKGMNGEPKLHEIAPCSLNVDNLNWNAQQGYEAIQASENPAWLRSLHSSLRTGKPFTWRRETGRSRMRELRRYAKCN